MMNKQSMLNAIVIGCLLAILIITGLDHTSTSTRNLSHKPGQTSFHSAIELAAPAVVNIYTQKRAQLNYHPMLDDPIFRRFFGLQPPAKKERMQSSLGSGVIADPEGYIITNNHVVADADEIVVALRDGRETPASIVGMDPETDLAVLRINLNELPTIPLGSPENVKIGDIALAIGNPFGIGQTITMGIVSAKGRSGLQLSTYENYIQTDAAINPGNSGGALINTNGELIGINTAIYSKSGGSLGIGFTIPTDTALNIMNQIINEGTVVRGWLGIIPQAMTQNLAASFGMQYLEGVIIADVVYNGPAFVAGVIPGDIITHINEKPVENLRHVMTQIAALRPGTSVELDIIRRRKTMQITAQVGTRP